MTKGIIVVDNIPVICAECHRVEIRGNNLFCSECQKLIYNAKPDFCPIKPIPQRAHHEDYCDNGRYDKGWNDCLNEVLGIDK